jgi:O-antigen ligase
MRTRLEDSMSRLLGWAMRFTPVALMVVVVSYFTAKQIATPHHRMIKMVVLGGMLVFMFRFDIVYSVWAFTILFPFPSGITIGSTNSIMVTLITLTWAIRATSTGQRVTSPTRYDWAIVLLLLAYVMSFYNCETETQVVRGLNVFWKQISAVLYFYLILRFVDDEKRLISFTKVVGVMLSLVVLTGVIELFAPGSTLIPGWFSLPKLHHETSITYRIHGLRLGGAVGAGNLLSDMCSLSVFILVYHAIHSRNPLERFMWAMASLASIAVLLGTANRGAFLSLALALFYTVFWFRHRVSFAKMVMIVAFVVAVFVGTQLFLDRFTYAASLTDRIIHTKMQGLTPDTRVGVWKPAFMKSLEHPLIGHGPYYDTGWGLTFQYWPHNAYIYYFYTIGLVGVVAFLWVSGLLVKRSLVFRRPGMLGTPLGDLGAIFHILLVMLLFGQLRTDHQRDDVNMYLVWLIFALVATTANVIDKRSRAGTPVPEGQAAGG